MSELPNRREGADRPLRGRIFAFALVLFAFVAMHQAYLSFVNPNALYMDSLRLLYQMEEWRRGGLSLFDIWWQGGSAHRGLFTQAFLLANVEWFSLDVELANRLTGVAIAACAAIVALIFIRSEEKAGGRMVGIVSLLAVTSFVVLLFSFAGFELLTLDLGLPLWMKNVVFILFFAAHGRFLGRLDTASCVGMSVAGVVIVTLIGMGWAYAFLGAVMATQLLFEVCVCQFRPRRWIPSIAMLAAIVMMSAVGTPEGSDPGAVSGFFTKLPLIFNAVGSGFMAAEAMAAYGVTVNLAGVLGAAAMAATGWAVLRRIQRGIASGPLMPLYLVAYGLLVAFSVAIARGVAGPEAVMASRYFMDIVLLVVGLTWLLAEDVLRSSNWVGGRLAGFVALFILVVAGHGLTAWREWQVAPYRRVAFEAANEAIRQGVPNEAAAQLLQSPIEHARAGVKVMKARRLSVFVDTKDEPESDVIAFSKGWSRPEPNNGIWMARTAKVIVPASPCAMHVVVYLPETFSARTIRVEGRGGYASTIALRAGETAEVAFPPSNLDKEYRLVASTATVPSRDIPGSNDQRELGALWNGAVRVCR